MSKIEDVVVKNITVKVSNLKKAFQGRYGAQYGAVLSGEGLEDLGLKPTQEGDGYWYNTNATYGSTGREVPPLEIVDKNNKPVTEELGSGSVIHGLFQKRHYDAGVRKDGTPYAAGFNVVLVAAVAEKVEVKVNNLTKLQDALLADVLEEQLTASPFK